MSTHVLLVEDDTDFSESVCANLEYAGYGVSGIARSGLEAFQLCEQHKPDVALIDIGLEGAFDGIFLGEQLAERGIAVIYLTGRFDRALREGREHAAGLLAKPCSLTDLTAAIDAAIQTGSQKQRASS
ncbi:response regulator [Rhodovibrio salinarum]|uniref:Response regulator n=1 Tax=Rhodovibrio salinarum TaxID=1087 RepID=A0A934QHA5_9PROT|nr:response regulator [Rhodovibrio salinarum]MBK1696757.1 response regulator [Rhodovibrio salinarum]